MLSLVSDISDAEAHFPPDACCSGGFALGAGGAPPLSLVAASAAPPGTVGLVLMDRIDGVISLCFRFVQNMYELSAVATIRLIANITMLLKSADLIVRILVRRVPHNMPVVRGILAAFFCWLVTGRNASVFLVAMLLN